MTISRSTQSLPSSLQHKPFDAIRRYLGGRRGPLAIAILAIVLGIALNWSWLVAAGIAPFLLTALPCVAMCALGLCMNRMSGRSCSTDNSPQKTAQTSAGSAALLVPTKAREP